MSGSKFLVTQSLLSSWQYALVSGDLEEFKAVLRREKGPKTRAMLEGIRFENTLQAVIEGAYMDPGHEWYKPIRGLSKLLRGSQYQVKLSRLLTVQGVKFLCYGVFDFLKAGVIYDAKYSKSYRVGKYLDSPQHPMYFYLCPEAYEFQYLICDGKWAYKEAYRRDDVPPIEGTISHFMDWLDKAGLVEMYCRNWTSKYG